MSKCKDRRGYNNAFVDSLCAMLHGMNTSTSRHVVSSPMSHLITMLDGTRFEYSHEFANLLISQLDATINGQHVDAHIQRNKGKSGHIVLWPDSPADDYIHCLFHQDTKDLYSYAYF